MMYAGLDIEHVMQESQYTYQNSNPSKRVETTFQVRYTQSKRDFKLYI